MKVLITGGAGFIGSHLADAFVKRGDQVTIIDNFSTGTADNLKSFVEIVDGDIRDAALMDQLVAKIDTIETNLEKYRPKTPQEKLQLRSLDSGPFKQNLADFFDEKKDEMEMSGKNEYVLTQDEVENFSPSDIEDSFNEPMEDEDDILLNRYNS